MQTAYRLIRQIDAGIDNQVTWNRSHTQEEPAPFHHPGERMTPAVRAMVAALMPLTFAGSAVGRGQVQVLAA
jgi:hypothetical protein